MIKQELSSVGTVDYSVHPKCFSVYRRVNDSVYFKKIFNVEGGSKMVRVTEPA